jgi:hypothetical protein
MKFKEMVKRLVENLIDYFAKQGEFRLKSFAL